MNFCTDLRPNFPWIKAFGFYSSVDQWQRTLKFQKIRPSIQHGRYCAPSQRASKRATTWYNSPTTHKFLLEDNGSTLPFNKHKNNSVHFEIWHEVKDQILKFNPDWVGYTSYTANISAIKIIYLRVDVLINFSK